MVHCVVDEDEWLADSALPTARTVIERVRGCRAPGVPLAIEERQTRVGDVISAVFVDALDVGRRGAVEGVAADEGRVFEIDGAADERNLVLGNAGSGLQVAPFGAVLVCPAAHSV